jgi:hypothetical protein
MKTLAITPAAPRVFLRRSMFAPALSPVEWVGSSMFSLLPISSLPSITQEARP